MAAITPQEAQAKIDALRTAREHGEEAEKAILDAYPHLGTKLGLRLLDLSAQTRWKLDQALEELGEYLVDSEGRA